MKRLLAVVLLCEACAVHAAEPLGRLFFTPEQRAQLDAARRLRPRMPYPEPEADEARPAGVVTYSGLVRRSDGRTTVWINDRAVTEKEDASSGVARTRVHRDGTASILLPERQGRLDLKVGQRADLATGRVLDGYARPPAAAPRIPPVPLTERPLRLRHRYDAERDATPNEALP